MFTKYLLLVLGVSSSLYPATGVNTTTPIVIEKSAFPGSFFEVEPKIKEVLEVWITAYSSTPEETDDTPFITASGGLVREGVVATNLLPFGTRVQIPEIFGDRVFVVEDRMHARKVNNVDVWMPSKEEAKKFGITYAKILVLN